MHNLWLYLEPSTFIWTKDNQGLIYNSCIGESFVFNNTGITSIYVSQLQDLMNLYCVEIPDKDIFDPGLVDFINKIKSSNSGGIIKTLKRDRKPAVLVPILNLQYNIEKLRNEPLRSIGENILKYLHEVIIYLNSAELKSPNFDKSDDKSKYYCTEECTLLPFEKLKLFLSKISENSLKFIKLKGNLLQYQELDLLLGELNKFSAIKQIFLPYTAKFLKLLQFTNESIIFNFKISFPINKRKLSNTIRLVNERKLLTNWICEVTSSKEFDLGCSLVEEFNLDQVEFIPIYTGKNIRFFKDYVYLTHDDMSKPGLNRREVFAHQILNTNDFGKLIISSNGQVFANT